jgi:hypothetical protein
MNSSILNTRALSFSPYVPVIIISIQPLGRFWQESEPSQATGMALARCILGKFLGVVCHCSSLPLDVPTFAARCLLVAKGGTVGEILPKLRLFTPFRDLLYAANLRHGENGFTSLPKEGMLRIFPPEKSDGFGRERPRDLGYQRPAC